MFRKFSFFVNKWVDRSLRENPGLETSIGFRRAMEFATEIPRYGMLLEKYQPPEWLEARRGDQSKENRVARAMTPARCWSESNDFVDAFKRAYRVECVMSPWHTNPADPFMFIIRVEWFEKRRRESFGFKEIGIDAATGETRNLTGRWS